MSDEQKKPQFDVPLADHEYDGIQELDNPAPFWWQFLFYFSIVFGVAYYFHYEVGTGQSSNAQLQEELTEIRKLQAKNQGIAPSEQEFLKLAAGSGSLENGKKTFQTHCASCHARDGGGLIGPNLTDRFWIHGKGSYSDLFKVISAGVLDKGMPAWSGMLSREALMDGVVYVKSLQGTRPALAKAPQGDEVKE